MDKAKTFPLRTTEGFLEKVEKALINSTEKSKHAYILSAIEEKIKREEVKVNK